MSISSLALAAASQGATLCLWVPSAPARGSVRSGGAYRRPRNIWILAVAPGGSVASVRSRSVLSATQVAENVDSRYSGPRSAYGQALARAERLLAEARTEASERRDAELAGLGT